MLDFNFILSDHEFDIFSRLLHNDHGFIVTGGEPVPEKKNSAGEKKCKPESVQQQDLCLKCG